MQNLHFLGTIFQWCFLPCTNLVPPCTTLYHQFGASRTTYGLICPIYGILRLFLAILGLPDGNLGLACKIGTFLGPNLDFGPIWDQVPNLGLHWSACNIPCSKGNIWDIPACTGGGREADGNAGNDVQDVTGSSSPLDFLKDAVSLLGNSKKDSFL